MSAETTSQFVLGKLTKGSATPWESFKGKYAGCSGKTAHSSLKRGEECYFPLQPMFLFVPVDLEK
jgi:hypothetical protein